MRYAFLLLCTLGVAGCGEGGPADDSPYASQDLWLCRPDIEDDYCDQADLTVTEIQPDGTRVVGDVLADPDAVADCFYVYPTRYDSGSAGNIENLVPPSTGVIEAVQTIGAQFRGVCRLFAPLYHQMSLSTYFEIPFFWQDSEIFETAYSDVGEAFDYYMRHFNEGRDFVLIGHSQGSHMLAKLIQDRLDNDEELRGQLLSALLMGPTAVVQVLEGELVGGTFMNVPLCTSPTDTGCVIAFDTNAAEVPLVPDTSVLVYAPNARACVNPASFSDSQGTLAAFTYRRHDNFGLASVIPFPDGIETEWVRYPNLYTSQCLSESPRVLEIDLNPDYKGDIPVTPQDLQEALHMLGYRKPNLHAGEPFMMPTDLVQIVAKQVATRDN